MSGIIQVQRCRCSTCIYRKDSPLDLAQLEEQVRDKHVGFSGYRACHHAKKGGVCCRRFWDRHRDEFQLGQIAQRLDAVEYVQVDDYPEMRRGFW